MENFKNIVLSPEEEGLYQKLITSNPEITRELFKEIRSGIMEKNNANPVINSDNDKIVAEVGEDYFENKKER